MNLSHFNSIPGLQAEYCSRYTMFDRVCVEYLHMYLCVCTLYLRITDHMHTLECLKMQHIYMDGNILHPLFLSLSFI